MPDHDLEDLVNRRHVYGAVAVCTVLAILVAATAASAMTPGKITKESLAFGERSVSYYLFVPKRVVAATPAPMLVLLHGSGRNGSTLVEPWKDLAGKEGIVLVGPDAQDSQAWNVPADGPAAICALVLELQKTLPVNPRRVYLSGHSAGAVFTLYMSVLESGFFAAGALHAGAWRAQDDFRGIAQAERKIPLAIWVGDRDQFFPVAGVTATAEAFRKNGHPVEFEIIKNHDHNYYIISGTVNAAVWAFLKGWQLQADPTYTPYQFR
jgi:poly(3-hydroxybutyrate) depolymerase